MCTSARGLTLTLTLAYVRGLLELAASRPRVLEGRGQGPGLNKVTESGLVVCPVETQVQAVHVLQQLPATHPQGMLAPSPGLAGVMLLLLGDQMVLLHLLGQATTTLVFMNLSILLQLVLARVSRCTPVPTLCPMQWVFSQ